jgi:hypothetical protein
MNFTSPVLPCETHAILQWMEKAELEKLYLQDGKSMAEIADSVGRSLSNIVYWMDKHGIARRSRSEATYRKKHPNGDPFSVRTPKDAEEAWLYGMGLGLYWGEGNKKNKWSVRLGNTDPALLRMFIKFLATAFRVSKDDLRFGLQIFTDISSEAALAYWTKELEVLPSQFMRPSVTISGSIGTYRQKSPYGVVTVLYHNKKLRDILVDMLPR